MTPAGTELTTTPSGLGLLLDWAKATFCPPAKSSIAAIIQRHLVAGRLGHGFITDAIIEFSVCTSRVQKAFLVYRFCRENVSSCVE